MAHGTNPTAEWDPPKLIRSVGTVLHRGPYSLLDKMLAAKSTDVTLPPPMTSSFSTKQPSTKKTATQRTRTLLFRLPLASRSMEDTDASTAFPPDVFLRGMRTVALPIPWHCDQTSFQFCDRRRETT